jgi:hypothetical protein
VSRSKHPTHRCSRNHDRLDVGTSKHTPSLQGLWATGLVSYGTIRTVLVASVPSRSSAITVTGVSQLGPSVILHYLLLVDVHWLAGLVAPSTRGAPKPNGGGIDRVAVWGVAEILAAIATVFLAARTSLMARETRALADEARKDRELAYRPHLSLVYFSALTGDPHSAKVQIKNVGAGAAIDTRVAVCDPGDANRWWHIPLGELKSGDHGPAIEGKSPSGDPVPRSIFAEIAGTSPSLRPELVMKCSDVLGNRYRFPVSGPLHGPSVPWRGHPPDFWRSSDRPTPEWAEASVLWS